MSRTPSPAWYALRRTLPPWSFEENLRELIGQLPRYHVDEIIVKVDTEEFAHGQPPLDWVREYQPKLLRIRDAMDELGVLFSINPWITVGHNDRGRDATRYVPGLGTMVGHDGVRCTACACPLSRTWREHVAKVWTLYAETRPHAIWVEDDIRTFNHRPVRFGCFCEEHMRRFSHRVGRDATREELVAAITAPGEPHPWRAVWLDLQDDVILETAGFLAKTVHTVSPQTRMGLMSSGPRNHCMEGRDWTALAKSLADNRPLLSRPTMGNYCENSLRGFYFSQDSIKITRHALPEGVIEQTEVENVPFTRYANSVAFTFVEMAVSYAYGSDAVTMNLFDHAGTPMERTPAFGRMIAGKKPFLNGLARRATQPGSYRGVRILHHGRSSYYKRLAAGADPGRLKEDGYESMLMLEAHGFPTTYDDSPIAATAGQVLRAFDDEQIRSLLSNGLLLDAVAAGVLVERGFGEMVGIDAMDEPVHLDKVGVFSAEEFYNPDFGGADRKYLTATIPFLGGRPDLSVMTPRPGAQVISRLVDPDTNRGPIVMFAFENALGGRVVVQAYDLASAFGPSYMHPFRGEQLRGAINWLGRRMPPISVRGDGVYPLAFWKDCGCEHLLGMFNLSLDPWTWVEFELDMPSEPSKVYRLTPGGRWLGDDSIDLRRDGRLLRVLCERTVPYDQPLFVRLRT